MRETTVERRLCALTRRRGGLALKWVSPGVNGVPDRILLLPGGRLFFVEVKTPDGRVSAIQRRMHDRFRRLGFTVHVVRDADRFFHDVVDVERQGNA